VKKSTNDREWSAYYAATRGRPPRPTLLRALYAARLPTAPPGRRAIDLGCGTGRDTLPLLAAGWHVLAVDAEPTALVELKAAVPAAWRPRLVTRVARFEHCHLPPAELVNASFSLFFAERQAVLEGLLRRIHTALVPGGRFAGHLLGPKDTWVRDSRVRHEGRVVGLDRAGLQALLRGFRLEHLEEEEDDAITPKGEAKHWHLWHINAVKA
jgi:tellurite methyltransferase